MACSLCARWTSGRCPECHPATPQETRRSSAGDRQDLPTPSLASRREAGLTCPHCGEGIELPVVNVTVTGPVTGQADLTALAYDVARMGNEAGA